MENQNRYTGTAAQITRAAARAAHEVSEAAAKDLEALDRKKADRPEEFIWTIPAESWLEQASGNGPEADAEEGDLWRRFPWYCDREKQGLTAARRADVTISGESVEYARLCGFCPAVKTRAGYIRVRANRQPEGEIRVLCRIT